MQRGLLAESMLADNRAVNVEQIVCELQEPLDVEQFRAAWRSALHRFDALRLEFEWQEPDDPLVSVRLDVDLPFQFEDWGAYAETEHRRLLHGFLDRDRDEGLDPFDAPLMRVSVFKLSDERWCFVWTVHHCIIDGGSYASVLDHVFRTYQGDPDPVDTTPSYLDFIRWAHEQDTGAGIEHFCGLLSGVPEPTELPLRNQGRARSGAPRVVEHRRRLDCPTSQALHNLAERCGASLNTLTQLVWGVLLSRYTRRDDVVFGSTWSGRARTIAGAKKAVGLFITTLPVRVDLTGDPSIEQALGALRQQHLEGRPFRHTPLRQLETAIDGSTSGALFRTLTVFERERPFAALARSDERWKARKVWSRSHTSYPLCLYSFVEEGALVVQLERDADFYSGAEGDQLLRHYVNLLDEVARNPDRPIHSLRMLDGERYEQTTVLEAAREDEPPQKTVLQDILEQARRRGQHPAVEEMGGRSITYAELVSRACSSAEVLEKRGVRSGDLVALLLPRSIETVVAMLATHYLGAAFLLVDPDCPPERVAFMLEDSRAKFTLVHGTTPAVALGGATVIDLELLGDVEPGEAVVPRNLNPESLAYVLYTSGSTGKPKGVCLSHGALSHHAAATIDAFELTPDDRVLQFAALCFDVSLEEIFPTLAAGATLVLRDEELAQTSAGFFEGVERHRLSVLNLPTAFWHQLTDSRSQATWPRGVRLLVVGGEQASPRAHRRFRAAESDWIRWINAYGPTETTITSTFYDDREDDHDEAIPIGRPHRGVSHFVLDHRMRPVPRGVVGELYIGGCVLARGYLGREELTRARFVPHPWRDGARLYATGDLVQQTPGGNYVYVDRVDHQVKLRGFRIELGEIETHLLACPGVNEAAVIAKRGVVGNTSLVAFVAGDRDHIVPARARERLASVLPSYMIPDRIVAMDELPKTPTGKVDRNALLAMGVGGRTSIDARRSFASGESIERDLAEIWTTLLGKPISDPSTNFFEAGGHSLLAVRLFNEIESRFGRSCDAQAFFWDPTLEGLARQVRGEIKDSRHGPIVRLAQGDTAMRGIFLTPGVTGLALDYTYLASALGTQIPVYGLRMPGLTNIAGAGEAIDAKARAYAELIRDVQPRGPYALAGYSSGGIIAVAVAEQLLELGQEVDFLGVLDGTPPATVPCPSPFSNPKRFARLARTTVARLREMVDRAGSIEQSARRVLEAAVRAPARWFGLDYRHDVRGLFRGASVDFREDHLDSMQAQLDAIMRYRPEKIPASLVLFRTALDPFEGPHEPDMGWGRALGHAVRIEWLPGTHDEVLARSGARRLAAAMMPYLRYRPAYPAADLPGKPSDRASYTKRSVLNERTAP